ncbi:MAG: Sporulation kinase A [Arcobacter lacus]|nr:MAG: Sporulation kinase A [Arcobacter lacus]
MNTNKIFFSKKWLEMYGYDRGDISSFDEWIELVHPDEKQLVHSIFKEHLEGKTEHLICEYRLKAKDKTYKWVLIRGKAFENENSRRVLLMSMNIDERMNLIKDLKNVELLTDFGRIVIFKWDNNESFDVKFVSKSIESYGYKVEDFMEKKIGYLDFVYKKDKEDLLKNIRIALKSNKESFTNIFRVIDANQKTKWVYNRNIIIKNDYGEVVELYGYINDITKMKLQEEGLKKQVKEELDKNLYKDRLLIQQNKLASMGEMLGNIAHQWRQPLNNVNLLIHLIRDNHMNFSEEKLNKLIKNAKEQIDFMSQTIDDFTDFYKPAKDKKVFSIEQVMNKSLSIVNAPLEKNKIKTIVKKIDVKITNYENEFEQVIVNILNNAVDAAKVKAQDEGFRPVINIDITKDEKNVQIKIFNNCGNIPKDIIDRVFEPYFTTKFQEQGTGIGLYMSKIIIENNMNGLIEVRNIDDGVEFIIKLPL